MSETRNKRKDRQKKRHLDPEKASEHDTRCPRIKLDRVCVIITQKKNSSWVEDLDALERLNTCRIVYH